MTGEFEQPEKPGVIAENFQAVNENIDRINRLTGREAIPVKLVVVTKGHSLTSTRQVINAGARYLGENYLEEAQEKISQFTDIPDLEWHMIGHVQSRKAAGVGRWFDWVEAVDNIKLATRLSRFLTDQNKVMPVLLECNVSGETTKYGYPAWDESQWGDLLPELKVMIQLPGIQVKGLMTIAPYSADPESARPYFARLSRLRAFLRQALPECSWTELSMGMSSDYGVAIQEGATIVRIGTAIMGSRSG